MRSTRVVALAGLMAICSLAPARTPDGKRDDKLVQEITDFRNRYLDAEESKDLPFLQEVLTDEFVAMNPQGQVLDRPHFLERMKDPERQFTVKNPREVQVHFYGNGTVAVWTEHVTVDGKDHGHPFGGEFRFVRIFTKQGGKWRVVLAQGTALPASSI